MKNFIKYLLIIIISITIGFGMALFFQSFAWKIMKNNYSYHYIFCIRCGKHFDETDFHTTWYKFDNYGDKIYPSTGFSPLCKDCWWGLKTPEARLIYYKKSVNRWWDKKTIEKEFPLIERALIEENNCYTNSHSFITNGILVQNGESKWEHTWKLSNILVTNFSQ